ncbi:hypothetical protein [Anoxybacteroides tepidamans]|uniref:hypothetical protein n=1 Tax=Anoxybacteroides tepidamans TaxID=265948 RepID=UPI0004895CCD|nr:hypothetical protein [Anoxybacillus tepidamans]
MTVKKNGKINEIVYEYTTYHSGKYRLYPTITHLKIMLEKIIESNTTTEYLRINPFYRNGKVDMQIEFDEYMFYLECREQFDEKEQEEHILDCLDTDDQIVTAEQFEMGKILYPLCQHNDVERFKQVLATYLDYLDTLLPKLFDIAKRTMQLKDEDLAFGYFCFEVHSE